MTATITIPGNIGKDAELRTTQGGQQVLNFNVAVNNPRDKQAPPTWFGVSLWGKRGESIQPFLTKGTNVTVVGEFSTREYEGKTYLECNAYDVAIQGGGQRQERGDGYGAGGSPGGASKDYDDEIPW